MTIPEIDHLTEAFYKSISFGPEHFPNFDKLEELFYGDGKLINNNFDKPVEFTVQSFSQAMMSQIEAGNAVFFSQLEIADRTEVFGKMAQRTSVYEFSASQNSNTPWSKGINYIQYIFADGRWQIISMIWADETVGNLVDERMVEELAI